MTLLTVLRFTTLKINLGNRIYVVSLITLITR